MNKTLIVFAAACAVPASAQPVSPFSLSGGTQAPFFAPEDDSNDASTAAWFTFTLGAATAVDIDINRLDAGSDLAATLMAGNVSGFDATAAFGLIDGVTADFGTVGPLTFLDFQDDTEDDDLGGPFGDPRFTLNLGPGTYSLAVYTLTGTEGNFSITSNVPAPASAALLGLGGLAASRRRR